MNNFRRTLATFVMALAALTAAPALAQTYSPVITTAADLGNIIPGNTASTTFTFPSSSGTVGVTGTGIRKSAGTVRALVTIDCTGTGNQCGNAVRVRVGTIGTPTGKAGALSTFTITANSGSITTAVTGTNPINFQITPSNKNTPAKFYIGAAMPIAGYNGAGATGAAESGYYVYTSVPASVPSAGTQGTVTAYTYTALSITGGATLQFGSIMRPSTGSATVSVDHEDNSLDLVGTIAAVSNTHSRATYTVNGEGGQAITVTVPTSMTMNRLGGGTTPITVTLTKTTLPTAIGGTIGSQSSAAPFYVGGNFTVSSTTETGSYQGTYQVTALYN